MNGGYGATIHFPNGDKKEIFNSSGSSSSNYIAKQQAIANTVNHINILFDTHIHRKTNKVIFTDSLSTQIHSRSLRGPRHNLSEQRRNILNNLSPCGVSLNTLEQYIICTYTNSELKVVWSSPHIFFLPW